MIKLTDKFLIINGGIMIEESNFLNKFVEVCCDGYMQGWHERNGGNLTYRLSNDEVEECKSDFVFSDNWVDMGVKDDTLGGYFFLTTASGAFMRNVISELTDSCGVVEINKEGSAYRIVWGLDNSAKPTSEFPSHYLNHVVRYKVTDKKSNVIYHAHPANVIALSSVLPLDAKAYTRAFWKVMTECVVIFPEGVGVLPWMVPGGSEIALATSKLMNDFASVIWSQHGIFCSGQSLDEAFGLLHTIEKAAEIYVKQCQLISSPQFSSLQCNLKYQEFPNTITDEELLKVADEFGVKINRNFLNL